MMETSPAPALGIIGGPQGPKSLLDAVRQAVVDGNVDALSRLAKDFIAIHENVNKCVDDNGNSIAHLALDKNPSTLEYIIEELHADVNAVNNQGRTPLHEAATHNYVQCCQVLLENGADDSLQSATLSTPFHTAAACGSVECMELILRHSDDPTSKINEVDRNRSSALHKCALGGDVRVCQWLIDHGASVEMRDNSNTTPLLVAVMMGQRNLVDFLLRQGADCNKSNSQGYAGVHWCAIRCDKATLDLLLAAGANVNALNEDGNNPLHLAAMRQGQNRKTWEDLIATLLLAGCNAQQLNVVKKIPSDYVSRSQKCLFTSTEVERRMAAEERQRKEQEADLERAISLYTTWKTNVLSDVAKHRQLEAEEDARLAKEAEALLRSEGDARMLYLEAVEMCHFQDEDIIKKKALLEKAATKGGR